MQKLKTNRRNAFDVKFSVIYPGWEMKVSSIPARDKTKDRCFSPEWRISNNVYFHKLGTKQSQDELIIGGDNS